MKEYTFVQDVGEDNPAHAPDQVRVNAGSQEGARRALKVTLARRDHRLRAAGYVIHSIKPALK